jgi:hypothetical protein
MRQFLHNMEETISQRIDRERAERKLLSDAQEFALQTGNRHKAQVTSSHRKAKIERALTKIEPVVTPRVTPAVGAPPVDDKKTISIVVVDNGEFKTGDFYISGELTKI